MFYQTTRTTLHIPHSDLLSSGTLNRKLFSHLCDILVGVAKGVNLGRSIFILMLRTIYQDVGGENWETIMAKTEPDMI